jgi:hypothetical protein
MHVRLYNTNAVELFAKNLPNFSFWCLHLHLNHQIQQLRLRTSLDEELAAGVHTMCCASRWSTVCI